MARLGGAWRGWARHGEAWQGQYWSIGMRKICRGILIAVGLPLLLIMGLMELGSLMLKVMLVNLDKVYGYLE